MGTVYANGTFVLELANRLAAASDVLGQLAQRDGKVAELMRLRSALEVIAEGGFDPPRIARRALRWCEEVQP
jgi:hypothetical protein